MVLVSRAVVVAVLSLLVVASPSSAWQRVHNANSIIEVGVARSGSGGPLNVLWSRDKTVFNTQISLGVTGGSTTPKITGPYEVFTYDNPAGGASGALQLLWTPDGGLRAFFAGLYPQHPLDVGLATATSADGKTWAVQPTLASESEPSKRSRVYVAAGIGGTIATNGAPISIWGDSAPGQAGYHVGTSDQTADVHFGGGSATVGAPNAATDAATGRVLIGWNDFDSARTLVQSIFPAGGRVNTPGGQAPDASERVAMTGRSGTRPGIFIAYLRGVNVFDARPAVWRFGAANPTVLSSQRGARYISIARGGGGRLWVFWARQTPNGWRIYAVRSNDDANKFGATVKVKPPKGTDQVFSLEGDGLRSQRLDLLALAERGPDDVANWYRTVNPGITLKASVLGNGMVRFTTLDAGDPLATLIKFAGKTGQTGGDGEIVMSAEPGPHTARATAGTGWTDAHRRVKVK